MRLRGIEGDRLEGQPRRRVAVTALMLALAAGGLLAQAPPGYYDSVDATNGATLRGTLHEVIDDHTRFPYTAATTDTWDILNLADEDPNNSSNIIDVYKNASYVKISGGTGAYNREHTWPKSYGFPNDGSDNYPYTDTHMLFLSDSGYNSSRSNKPYRNCDAGCSEQPTDFNDGRGGGSGVYPGNSNWTQGSFTQGTWETWDGRKGDVARAIFYMDVRYEGGVHNVTGVSEPDLIVTDVESLIDASNTGANESVAYMGMLTVLLQWHAQDPVDSREIWRNETVYTFQGNRNPFIDHPEWVDCVYSEVCSTDTTPPAPPSGLMATAGNGSVDLSWLANGEPDLAGYNVYRSTTAGGPYGKLNGLLVDGTAFTDATAANGTTYYYVVTAVDTSSNESGDSNEASATPDAGLPDVTPPAAPTGLGATPGDGQVDLAWSANGEPDLAGYNVHRGTSAGGPYAQLNGALLATASYTDATATNGTTYYYVVTAVDTSSNESGDSNEASATPAAPGGGGVVLSEVLYDVSGGDGGFEWVEIYNAGPGAVDLSVYCLGNGGTSYTYSTAQLAGTVASGATFVVGGPGSSATNANPAYDQVLDFNPDFQNSGSTADGVALFDVTCAQVTGSTVPVDAVVYGGSNGNNLIDETGAANPPEVGDAPPGSSIERLDLAGAWQIQSAPTPNATTLPPPSGNQAPAVTITAPADGASFAEGSSISFAGTASDAEDGDLTAGLSWTSDLDGAIGSGGSFSAVLSVGTHAISASVTDSGGAAGADAIFVTVNPNTAPTVGITAPADGSSFDEGTSISFAGTATDAEEGDLTAGLAWTSDLDGAIGSGGSFSAVLSVGTHVVTASVTDGGGLQGSDAVTVTVSAVAGSPGDLRLSEVFYDADGTDDGLEWVEIYNNDSVAIDLSGFSLGNGGNDYTTSLVQLAGTVQPGATFVVGGPTSSAANHGPVLDQAVDFAPDFQNSGTAGDGVALFNLPAASVTAATVPIDAVVYGPNNNNGLIDESGSANAPEVGDASPGSSIERLDLAGAWQIQSAPTPNATPLNPPANTAPAVTITAPADGSSFTEGTSISFAGTASDAEEGDLTASLAWSSDLDGALGSGGGFSAVLSVGSHVVTASVTDSGGLQGSDAITVTVNANTAPTVTITAPADGSSFGEGISISFTGSASDAEDGDLTASLAWSSDLDGALGTGGSVSATLSVGTHTVTASVTDAGGLQGSDAITVTVDPAGGPVTVTFTSVAAEDGWVRESSENSNAGGRTNSGASGGNAIRAGDNRKDRQYKGVVSFDTSALPDGATIVSATLRLRRGTVSGTNPFSTHGTCWVDVHSGGLGGSTALADGDFEAVADVARTAALTDAPANGDWSEGSLDPVGLTAVNKTGTTQLRIYFDLDDDDDGGNDFIGYYPGDNSDPANRPQLEVTYQE